MPYLKDTLEINSIAFKYHREPFVENLTNWTTQTVNNKFKKGIMHRFLNLCILETRISKAQRDGVKYFTQVIPYSSTTPECENVWRVRMTRNPSPLFRVFSSVVLIPFAAHAPRIFNWRCAKLFTCAPILGGLSCHHISEMRSGLAASFRHSYMSGNHPQGKGSCVVPIEVTN